MTEPRSFDPMRACSSWRAFSSASSSASTTSFGSPSAMWYQGISFSRYCTIPSTAAPLAAPALWPEKISSAMTKT